MSDFKSGKHKLRAQLRAKRRALTASQQQLAAKQLTRLVQTLPAWHGARTIAVYRDADGEIGTAGIAAAAVAQGKRLYLPVVGANRQLEFANWTPGETLKKNNLGIAEPMPSAQRCAPTELNIIFLPLVGWDKQGNRLGMGGGYYDTTLAGVHGPVLVGLGHSIQEMAQATSDSWDIKLQIVVTDRECYACCEQRHGQ